MDLSLQAKLLKILKERFSEDELRNLCFLFGIDYEDLRGNGKAAKALELFQFLERRERIAELIEVGKIERPDIDWKAYDKVIADNQELPQRSPLLSQYYQFSNELSNETQQIILESIGDKHQPLDWDYPFEELYTGEQGILKIQTDADRPQFLPQVLVLGPEEAEDEAAISLVFVPSDFQSPQRFKVEVGLEFYKRNADGSEKMIFFDGVNARLVDWNPVSRQLTFQGNSYFDYLQTNLSLDYPLPTIGSLRKYLTRNGMLEPLNVSKLANTTGINGLLFSNDGYMIIQKRGNNVLIRPGELCSGFSGTIDKEDVEKAMQKGGKLADLDTLREMAEEVGIKLSEVGTRRLLGITRELIRGGAPEVFYALDVNLTANDILSRYRRDKEGKRMKIFLGPYAEVKPDDYELQNLPSYFWTLIKTIQTEGDGYISIPMLTNLALWYKSLCPDQVSVGSIADT
jgi:hypothetical protein